MPVSQKRIFDFCYDAKIKMMFSLLKLKNNDDILFIGANNFDAISALIDAKEPRRLNVSIIDSSEYIFNELRKKNKNKADVHIAPLSELPFEDNSFSSSIIFHSLEFADDAEKILEEAFRVSKDKVFILCSNKYSFLALRNLFRRRNRIRLFSVRQIKEITNDKIGEVPFTYKSISILKIYDNLIYKFFGDFLCILIKPKPRYLTNFLPVSYKGNLLKSKNKNMVQEG